MKTYHVGLDFGTHHTKVCILDVASNIHEFFVFPTSKNFFLLSRVAEKPDGTFEYGDFSGINIEKEYYYFKIASAEDEVFRTESETESVVINNRIYDLSDFSPYTPEFLATIYISYILLTIRDELLKKNTTSKKSGGLLRKLFTTAEKNENTIKLTIRLGIPTEWSQRKNIYRKRKFESILLIADELHKKYLQLESFLAANKEELKKEVLNVQTIYSSYSRDEVEEVLNERGLSVYPETAAGLTFVTQTRQLNAGYYAIIDIGGGSTDISFFNLINQSNIRYIASESYIIAANSVYKKILLNEGGHSTMHNLSIKLRVEAENGTWKENDNYLSATATVRKHLEELIYKLFFKRVHWFHMSGLSSSFKDQPIIAYGGGFELPYILNRRILINDHGVRTALINPYYMEVSEIHNYRSKIDIRPDEELWIKDISLLVVALGLSFIKPLDSADWFKEGEYHSVDGDTLLRPQKDVTNIQPHPVNEDCYIYDILASKFE